MALGMEETKTIIFEDYMNRIDELKFFKKPKTRRKYKYILSVLKLVK